MQVFSPVYYLTLHFFPLCMFPLFFFEQVVERSSTADSRDNPHLDHVWVKYQRPKLTFRGPYLCKGMKEMTFNRQKQISESIPATEHKPIQPLKNDLYKQKLSLLWLYIDVCKALWGLCIMGVRSMHLWHSRIQNWVTGSRHFMIMKRWVIPAWIENKWKHLVWTAIS